MADPRGGRPRDPGNDAAILDAALDLLIERGADGASIEAIARRAGVAKLTVYRRWKSKEDLLMAAVEHGRKPDTPERTIEALVESTAELWSRPRFRALVARVIGASVDHPKLVRAYTDRYLRPRLDALAEAAQQAVADGRFAPGTTPTMIQDILLGSTGLVLLNVEAELTAEQISARLWDLLRQLGYRA